MTLEDIHAVLQATGDTLAELHLFSEDISPDTARVVGFVQGVIATAKIVVASDVANKADVEQQEVDEEEFRLAEQQARKESL